MNNVLRSVFPVKNFQKKRKKNTGQVSSCFQHKILFSSARMDIAENVEDDMKKSFTFKDDRVTRSETQQDQEADRARKVEC